MGVARGRLVFHGLVLVGLALNVTLGGAGDVTARAPASAAPVGPGAPGGAVTLTATDPRNAAVRYRVVADPTGPTVEQSANGGAQWTTLLTSGLTQQLAAQTPAAVAAGAGCAPANYVTVRALAPVAARGASAPTLYIATAGRAGDYLEYGCDSAVGGLFARQPGGSVTPLGSAGLPYDQDPASRTIRAYDVDMVTPDPQRSAVLYVHAGPGTGPGSPPEGLYKSIDGGQHWTEIDNGIRPSAVITNSVGLAVPKYGPGTFSIAPGAPQRLTWTTDTGTYTSLDGGAHWQPSSGVTASPTAHPAPVLPAGTPVAALQAGRSTLPRGSPAARPAPSSGALAAGGAGARGARASFSSLVLGLDEGWALNNNGSQLVTSAQIATTYQVGARYVRINFRLGSATSWTSTLLSAYDTVVNNYISHGIQVLGLVNQEATHGSNQAQWTANNYEYTGGNGDNSFIANSYRGALQLLVAHFHDRVKLWELWNEPNVCTTGCGTANPGGTFIFPSNFAALLADAYGAIKPSYPDVTLISGGIFGHDIGGVVSPNNAGATYLQNTFIMGVGTTGTWQSFMIGGGAFPYPLDGIGQHLYVDQGGTTSSSTISSYYTWLHQVPLPYVTPQPNGTPQPNSASLPPSYLTEGAWSTHSLSQDVQAQNLDTLFQTTKGVGFVPLAIWFELQDNPPGNQYFGLIDQNGNYKQSYSHYQAQATAAAITDTPTNSPTPTVTPTATATNTAVSGGQSVVLQLTTGWNLISLSLTPSSGTLSAATLLRGVLQNSGGHMAALYQLTNNQWSAPVIVRDSSQSGTDFPLQVGMGYLVYSDANGSYTETGSAPPAVSWSLNPGWNLVGVGQTPLSAWAQLQGLLASSHTTLAAIYGLTRGSWSPALIDDNGAQQGSDFPLLPGQGYLLYTQQGLSYSPGAVSGGAAPAATARAGGAGVPHAPALPASGF
jgi:hypothetical protein